MSNRKFPKEKVDLVKELLARGMKQLDIAKQVECSVGMVSKIKSGYTTREELIGKKLEIKTEMINGTMVTTSNMLLAINDIENKTPTDMMILHGYDPLAWEVMSVNNKAWNGTSRDQGTYTMFSSSVKVKPIELQVTTQDIKNVFNDLTPKVWSVKSIKQNTNLFAVVDLFDIHLGKLAWDEETGENYDLKIATKIVRNIIDENVEYLMRLRPKQIVFPIGNDLFHSDNEGSTTFHGTPQDMATRPKKVFKRGIDLIFESIGKLSQVAPVIVPLIPGNHDATTSYYLSEVMSKAFENNPNVEVDTSPKPRMYYIFDKVLLGFTHSNEESKKELPGLMAKEVPELWGKSKYREFHFGHIHIENTLEDNGMKYRWVPSISGPDKWHFGKGYVETDRTSVTYIYDEKRGLQTIKYFRGR